MPDPEIIVDPGDFDGPPLTDEQWAAQFDWAVTDLDECMGFPVGTTDPPQWALYDRSEDDPPVAIFDFEDWADIVCRILRKAGERDG